MSGGAPDPDPDKATITPTMPTPWESLVTTVVGNLIDSLPGIIRDGYTGDDVRVPPYDDVPVPDVSGFDTGLKPPLCPILSKAVATTRLSAFDVHLTGLDSVAAYASMTFPVQDVELSVPLIFDKIVAQGNWETHSSCAKGTDAPIDTVHNGTFVVRIVSMQVSVDVRLNPTASIATAVTVTLTDATKTWSSQPVFDPSSDVTFDPTTTGGEVKVLSDVLKAQAFWKTLRDSVKGIVEGPDLANVLRTVINDVLANVA
jgi:hypothetical protein